MSDNDPYDKLRKLVPWIVGAIFILLGSCVILIKSNKPSLWPLIVGDTVFTLTLVYFLWKILGRRS
jgi:membrane associated rhomboid family serine protease